MRLPLLLPAPPRRLLAKAWCLAPLLAAGLLGGCHGNHAAPLQAVVLAGPAQADLAPWLRPATNEGLVAFNEEGKVVPALAERWLVTDNGLTYVFRLKMGNWGDGTPITPDSVRAALHQASEAAQTTDLGPDLEAIDEVRSMAARVIEIRLNWPVPDFLQVLAQPELALSRRGKGAGPMLGRWREGRTMLSPMAEDAGADEDSVLGRALVLRPAAGDAALADFAAGRADVVLGGTFATPPTAARTALGNAGLGRGAPRFDPAVGLFGLLVARPEGFLATPAMREALAMAIDRDSLAASLIDPGFQPTTRVVAGGLPGDAGLVGERWGDIDLEGRRTLAMRRISAWVQTAHAQPVLTIALPAGAGGRVLFDRLAMDMNEIGVKLQRVEAGQRPDLVLIDKVARYARASWFLHALSCRQYAASCSSAADVLTRQAEQSDPQAAPAVFAEAERKLTETNFYIPLGRPIRWSLVSGEVAGFAVNPLARHPLLPLSGHLH